jgi:[glutamine synthetase] adenylyltransferase / [glutamine synthetase]-adenylyl-L-tyrosine phosphorylase
MNPQTHALTAGAFSPFFERSLQAFDRQGAAGQAHLASLLTLIQQPLTRPVIEAELAGLRLAYPVDFAMRYLRHRLLLALIERDTRGQATLDEVCGAMTDLAEITTTAAFSQAASELQSRFGLPRDHEGEVVDLLAVGMGKAGGRELNVSSDLDLIFVFRDEGQSDGTGLPSSRIATSDWMHRAARRAVQLLADINEAGFVFRVDTRLRPNGDSGPLVASLAMLERYFFAQGREWERFAWIKGRVIASTGLAAHAITRDIEALYSIVRPFVFRRYLDFRAIGALRDLHQLIRNEMVRKDSRAEGSLDVKLGRGGIREIEFIAQLFQIVRGGRDTQLRDKRTLVCLDEIALKQLLPIEEVALLQEAYAFLRRTEHALQYREDEQTHRLPARPDQRALIAQMIGLAPSEFENRLVHLTAAVQRIFDHLLGQPEVSAETSTQLEAMPQVQARMQALRSSARFRGASTESQQAIETIVQQARQHLTALAGPATTDHETAIKRLVDLLEAVSGRGAYLALLAQYPQALARVLRMVGQTQWAAQYLVRHPIVLDELLDGQLLEPIDLPAWRNELDASLQSATLPDGTPDIERQMDWLREMHHAQVFRLLAQSLEERLSIEALSDGLSALADAVIEVSLKYVWHNLRLRFEDPPRFAVIAYGKLGGKELGFASDLDLVFLYDDQDERATHAYAQLAQRLSGWLATTTSAGLLFEIDLRLRPNGNAGLLVSTVASFRRYQLESAWLWEHQALTRARFCAGDIRLGEQFEVVRREVIAQPRDLASLAKEVQAMRQKMLDGHPNRSALFDIKHDRGGMVDIEFAVQFLVLGFAHRFPDLLDNLGNIALLQRAAMHGLLTQELARNAADAYREYRRMQHACRLNGDEFARVPAEQCASSREAVLALSQAWIALAEA